MNTMLCKGQFKNKALLEFIRGYEVFRFVFDKAVLPPAKYHVPRPEHSLTFYPREAQSFSHTHSTNIVSYPKAVINGIYNVPINRYGGHDFLAIRVVFQPTALFRLTGMPLTELTNTFVDAEAIWTGKIRKVSEQIEGSDSLEDVLSSIESFLIQLMTSVRKNLQAIDKTSQSLLQRQGNFSLDQLADQSCLSIRQFIRNFEERIGVSPKQFARIVRFDKAYRMHNMYPLLDWFSIAIDCGYYDYQHFAKDCKDFTFLNPNAFSRLDQNAPERHFGLQYI